MDIIITEEIRQNMEIHSCILKQGGTAAPVKIAVVSESYFLCIIASDILNRFEFRHRALLAFQLDSEQFCLPLYLDSFLNDDKLYLVKLFFQFSDLPQKTNAFIKELIRVTDIVQKRKEERIVLTDKICTELSISPNAKLKTTTSDPCLIRDISFSGASCITPAKLYKGQKVILCVEFCNPHLIAPLFAMIVRTQELLISNHSFQNLGIQYLQPNFAYQQRLKKHFDA